MKSSRVGRPSTLNSIVWATCIAVAPAVMGVGPQPRVELKDLTVPKERLPATCSLPQSPSVSFGGNQVRGGLWTGLAISSNPWIGTDRPLVAEIRERVEGPAPIPDGPPLSAGQLAAYRLGLAEGIEAAYAAIYADPEFDLVAVYAVKFTADAKARARVSDASAANVIRIGGGRVLVVISGGPGWGLGAPCS